MHKDPLRQMLNTDHDFMNSYYEAQITDSVEQAQALRQDPGKVLQQEGLTRDLMAAVASARKAAGLNVKDPIKLTLQVSPLVWDALYHNITMFVRETLTEDLVINDASGGDPFDLGTKRVPFPVNVRVEKAETKRFSLLDKQLSESLYGQVKKAVVR